MYFKRHSPKPTAEGAVIPLNFSVFGWIFSPEYFESVLFPVSTNVTLSKYAQRKQIIQCA